MVTKNFVCDGATFVTNNYVPILSKEGVPADFDIIQDILSSGSIFPALTQPEAVSAKTVLEIWRTCTYNDGGSNIPLVISFTQAGETYEITQAVVVRALSLPEVNSYQEVFIDAEVTEFLLEIGYFRNMIKLGKLTRPHLKRE